ncbi:hypothetical protein, partial [Lactococcus petauri]|uniref:hypothetical protein n=1 Tax=Lactococcus petauri TaxID=1940789 RepID=UPI0021F21679
DPRNTLMELFTQTSDNLLGDLANRATNGWYIHNNINGIENFGRAVYDKSNKVSTVISTGELGVNVYALRGDPVNQTTAASNTLGWLWS